MKKTIAVIITIWKRNHLLEQLDSILNQSVKPEEILIIQNENYVQIDDIILKFSLEFPRINLVKSNHNLKYFFRFSIASLIETDYIFLIDDDIIPGKKWLEICLNKSKKYNAIISCSGRVLPNNDYRLEDWERIPESERTSLFVGDYNNDESCNINFCKKDTIVDYGCNSYFIKSEWMQYFWAIWPITFLSGEDIHLSVSAKLGNDILTLVPKQIEPENCGNLKKKYGTDNFASWKRSDFVPIREKVFKNFIDKRGWKPILWNK